MEPESYNQFAIFQKSCAIKMLSRNYDVISNLPIGSRALDICCGTGQVTQLLSYYSNLKEIVGIDLSPKMINSAAKNLHDPRVRFQVADIEKPEEYPPGEFNLIVANAALHWAKDQRKLIQTITKKLTIGGYFLAGCIYGGPLDTPDSLVQKVILESEWTPKLDQVANKLIFRLELIFSDILFRDQ